MMHSMRTRPGRATLTALGACAVSLAFTLMVPSPASADAVELQGEVAQGAILIGSTEPGTGIRFRDEEVPVTSDGRFVIGLPRHASGTVVLEARHADGSLERRELTVSERDFPFEVIEGVPQETVTPPPEVLQRIRDEQVLIDRARSHRDDRADFARGWSWPVTGRMSGVYGSARTYNDDDRVRVHWGVDVAEPTGTPVRAPAAGIVRLAHPDLYFSGGTILLDHGTGMVSSFLHLSKLHVEDGQRVERGELIGEIGASGRATGAHLDWRIKLRGTWVDPATLLPPMSKAQSETD